MPIINRKRRAPEPDESSESEVDTRNVQRQQRRRSESSSASEVFGDGTEGEAKDAIEEYARKLVRYSLSCEYSRQVIRRQDVLLKVLNGTQSRQFKAVFDEAQLMLKSTFGMELTELPVRDKVTLAQRRAAQKAEKQPTSSGAWLLSSTLPDKYKTATIIPPPRIPTSTHESAYVGLYTFIVSMIYLQGGKLGADKLERYLARANADQTTPIDKTDKLLTRLQKEGYIVKVKDSSTGEDMVDYMVGPRGKVEISEEGVADLVKAVYGDSLDEEELNKRVQRSLGLGAAGPGTSIAGAARGGKRRRRRQAADGGEEESDGELTLDSS